MKVFCQVPSYGELAVPEELLAEGEWQFGTCCLFEVALLHLVVVACQLAVERDTLRQIVQAYCLGEGEPLALALQVAEWLEGLIDWRVAVVEHSPPLVLTFPCRCLAGVVAVCMAVAEGEVGRVVRHGVAFCLDAHTHVRQREVCCC